MVYLKKMEAHGFKSFADKADISFDAGVTAVVGPNGSGKSNITDAIRWVLGEQSARSIRGVKMEDVIFNGTADRKAMNYAYVRLVLDNASRTLQMDADEVHITRKLYRNGDSEYYINKERARLKEINELFLDSGLGRNAYNIISQGEVDEVLKAKPEQRRGLIEEAAGVMKYKLRKKESEKRLEETADNLDRVHDIIHELEGRVHRLEKESATAEEYLALKEEMRNSDIEVTVYDVETLMAMLNEEAMGLQSSEAKIKEMHSRLAHKEKRMTEIARQRDSHDEENAELNRRLVDLTKKLEQASGRIELYKERKDTKGQTSEELSKRLAAHQARAASIDSKHRESLKKAAELSTAVNELTRAQEEIATHKKELLEDHSGEIETLKDEYYDLMVEKTTLENECRRAESEKSRLDDNIRQKKERAEELEQLQKTESTQHAEEKARHEEILKKMDANHKALQAASEALKALEADYDSEKNRLDTARHYIEQQKSKVDMLNAMHNEYRGYYPGARFILKNRAQLNGIIGAVGEMLSADKRYVKALDTALGAQAQNIITHDEQSAKAAISKLKAAKAGFATFLPRTTIRQKHLHKDIRGILERTSIKVYVMSEIADHDDSIADVVSHLLGTTLVVETIDDATALASEINHRLRIVTLDGDTIMPGGAMSGGSKSAKGSIIENQQELQETKESLEVYRMKTRQIEATVKQLADDLASQMEKKDKLEQISQQLAAEKDKYHGSILRLGYQIEARADNIRILREELSGLGTPEDTAEKEERIAQIEVSLDHLDRRITQMNASDKDKKETLQHLTDEGHATSRELAAVKERLRHAQDETSRLEEEQEEITALINEVEEQQKMISEDLNEMDIERLEKERIALSQEVEALNHSAEEKSSVLYALRKEYEELESDRRELLPMRDELQEAFHAHKTKKEKLDIQVEQKIEYLSETYKITYDRAKETHQDLTDIDQKRMKISLNRKSIDELGPVNLAAIEEYARVGERYQFLKTQEADLLEARDTLLEVIREMDGEVAVRFKETFNQINARFGEVFQKMFGGGQAELRLTIEDDYLESGVEIYAQPPGKRLSTLSLLSGGERALTAISLLFSILQVRVSPFIILDEVEAALDESNVLRYAQYLKALAKETQFIVITHRKGTMEESDRLFGVTMQERGVSQLISVDLKDYEENIREEETV